jgi:hypothetical protein
MAASTISLLAGIWLFVSPWVYGTAMNSWNSWIVGAAVVILAACRLGYPMSTQALSWINCLLGIWTFASPWIYGYTVNQGRFINSLCVGVILFVASIASANSTPHSQHPIVTHTAVNIPRLRFIDKDRWGDAPQRSVCEKGQRQVP